MVPLSRKSVEALDGWFHRTSVASSSDNHGRSEDRLLTRLHCEHSIVRDGNDLHTVSHSEFVFSREVTEMAHDVIPSRKRRGPLGIGKARHVRDTSVGVQRELGMSASPCVTHRHPLVQQERAYSPSDELIRDCQTCEASTDNDCLFGIRSFHWRTMGKTMRDGNTSGQTSYKRSLNRALRLAIFANCVQVSDTGGES